MSEASSKHEDGAVPHPDAKPVRQCFSCNAYLFDIDGTLLNSRDGVHYHAFHHAVREVFGIDSSIDGVPVHGNTDIGILRAVARRAGLTDATFEAALPQALRHMCKEVSGNRGGLRPELCPSVVDLLEALRGAGKLMGIVSGNLDSIGWLKLRVAGIADYFAFGSFSAEAALNDSLSLNESRADIFRQGIRRARSHLGGGGTVCIVGDTPSDIAAAREVAMPVIAVATGIFSAAQLRELNPDFCVECCADLLPHLRFTDRQR
jgi:phosphoglycolate phosphatase